MQRELKFRMWDKINGKMHMIANPEPNDNGLWFDLVDADLGDNHNDDECTEIMQFTGLKDKNGVDIYEGDVLRVQLPMGGFWGNVRTEKVGKVFYEPENAGYLVMWPGGKNQNFVQLNCDSKTLNQLIRPKMKMPIVDARGIFRKVRKL